jgi:predicted enzyme related to lactoylglutathione lyase
MQSFYSDLFGCTINSDNPMGYGMASTRDGHVGIDGGIFARAGEDMAGLRIYAQVDDADAVLQKAEELGGRIVTRPQELPDMGIKVAQFTDPEGNLFGVVQPL